MSSWGALQPGLGHFNSQGCKWQIQVLTHYGEMARHLSRSDQYFESGVGVGKKVEEGGVSDNAKSQKLMR